MLQDPWPAVFINLLVDVVHVVIEHLPIVIGLEVRWCGGDAGGIGRKSALGLEQIRRPIT